MSLRVAIDVRTVEPRMRGIGRCTYQLVRALRELDDLELVLLGTAASEPYALGLEHVAIPYRLGDTRWEAAEAGRLCQALGVDLYHGPAFAGAWQGPMARVVTVHDLAFLEHPDCYQPAFRAQMRLETARAAAFADRCITNSHHTADELQRWLGTPGERIEVIHPGVDPAFLAGELPERGQRPRVLVVGLGQPRKRAALAIEAFARLPAATDAELLIVGESWSVCPEARAAAERCGVLERVRLSGPLDDEALLAAYRSADALLVASLHEGFGLPCLEALACGVPVVACDVAALPEATGPHARRTADDPAALAAALAQTLETPPCPTARQAARAWAARFDWPSRARQTRDCYRRAVEAAAQRAARPRRRIGVDARFLGAIHTGTGRHTSELIEQAVLAAPDVRWVLFAPPAGAVDRLALRPLVDVQLEGEGQLLSPAWEDGPLAAAAREADLDGYLGLAGSLPASLGIWTGVVAYDLGWHDHPEFYDAPLLAYLRERTPAALRQADAVLANSSFTRRALIETLGIGSRVVPSCGDHLPRLARRQPARPYWLSISSGGPNKNVAGLLAAYARSDADVDLRLVGSLSPAVREAIASHPRRERIHCHQGIDDDALAELLAGAQALVFLSRYEGFGLPVAEALHAGVPVISTAAGGLAELVAGRARVVDPDDARALDRALASADQLSPAPLPEPLRWHRAGAALVELLPPRRRPAHRVGLVTPWGGQCGIASYAGALAEALSAAGEPPLILAEHGEPADDGLAQRCWRRGQPLDGLLRAIEDAELSCVHIQHHDALFAGDALCELLWGLRQAGVSTVLTVHELGAEQAPSWLLMPDRLIVHSPQLAQHLRAEANVRTPLEVIPIGVATREPAPARPPGAQLLSLGFLHPHKGYADVIEALPAIAEAAPEVRYRVLGARRESAPDEPERLLQRAAELGVADRLELEPRFASEAELEAAVDEADVVIYPYRRTPLGSSASVGLALAAGKPVVTSRTAFFGDLGEAVLQVDRSDQLAPAILELLRDRERASALGERAVELAHARRWEASANRHRAAYAAARRRPAAITPWISLQIVAREIDALGLAWYRSCLESLTGYPDELIVVDNGSSPEVLAMVRELLPRFANHRLIEAPAERDFSRLRNLALEATDPRATHVHWVDSDEIFRPHELPELRRALRDPRVAAWSTVLVHLMIDPERVENRQVKWNVFRYAPGMRWSRGVHEVLEGGPAGPRSFAPIEHLHLGYCRPQWQTFLKWLRYAELEHGDIERYRLETVAGRRLPWLRGARTPNTILDERIPLLRPFRGPWPPSCAPWLAAWRASGLPWAAFAETQVDPSPWRRLLAIQAESRHWTTTLDRYQEELRRA